MSSVNPSISIIIPNRNGSQTIGAMKKWLEVFDLLERDDGVGSVALDPEEVISPIDVPDNLRVVSPRSQRGDIFEPLELIDGIEECIDRPAEQDLLLYILHFSKAGH